MVLSDRDIKKYIKTGEIKISPKPDFASQLGSCSLDLRLGDVFRVYDNSSVAVIDPYDRKIMDKLTNEVKVTKGEAFILHPGEFALAVTEEYIELPDDLTARLEGQAVSAVLASSSTQPPPTSIPVSADRLLWNWLTWGVCR